MAWRRERASGLALDASDASTGCVLLTRATLTTPLPGSVLWRVQGLLVSGLTGETGELTFVAKGKAGERLTMDGVLQELERLIDELISPTKVIRVEDGILFDVPEAHAQKLIEVSTGHRLSRAPPQAAGMIAQSSMCETVAARAARLP